MAEYDGSIRINTKIDTANLPSQMQKIVNSIKKAEGEVERLRAKMDALKNQKIPMQDYAQLQAELRKAEARADSLYGKLRVMEKSGVDRTSASYARLREQIAQADRYIDELRTDMQDMESSGKAFTLGGDSEEYAKMAARVEELTGKIEASKTRLAEMAAKQRPVSSGFESMRKSAASLLAVLGGFGRIGGKAFGALKNAASKAFSAIHKGTKKSSGLLSTFASRLKGITLSLLIFNWITKGFNAMVSGMKTGFGNLMQYSSDFANSVQSMKNAMATLGNQFAAAFAPIVQMVIPWLRSLINALSTAMSYVAQFIALLGGKSTFTRAKQIQDSYNKSLDGTASSAKKAYGALAKFDDLDVLQKKEDDAAGAGAGVTQPEDMFEEVPVDPKLLDLFDWLKDMWENADFYDLGKMLGEKLKDALDNIPWDEIKEAARRLGKSLASLINGFIEVEGLGYSIGRTLAEAINTGFEFLNSFVHELHWDSIGAFIAEELNGVFENLDLQLIYDTFVTLAEGIGTAINSFVEKINIDAITEAISSFVNTVVSSIKKFFETAKWDEIGKTIGKLVSDTIKKIDWENMGETITEIGKSLLELFDSAVESVEWDEVGYAIRDFLEGINWTELLQGLGGLIEDALVSAIDMAVAAIGGEDFYNKFKEWQANNREKRDQDKENINSWLEDRGYGEGGNPYEKMVEQNNQAWEEMKANEQQKRSEIEAERKTWWENAHNQFSDAWTSLKESAATAWDNIKQTISEKLTSLKESILLGWENIKQFFSDTWTGIKETAIEIWTGLQEWFGEFWISFTENLSIVWENIKTFLINAWTAIEEKAISIWEAIRRGFEEKINAVRDKMEEIKEKFDSFREKVFSVFENIKETVVSAIDAVKGAISGFIGLVESAISAIQSLISSASSIGGSIGSAISGFLGISAPDGIQIPVGYDITSDFANKYDIPRLASGAVIRGGNPFAAILGDQPRGQVNIEAPLDTIRQAVREELLNMQTDASYTFIAQLDGRTIFEETVAQEDMFYNRTGRGAFAHG